MLESKVIIDIHFVSKFQVIWVNILGVIKNFTYLLFPYLVQLDTINEPYFPQNVYIPIPVYHCGTNKRKHMKKYSFYIFAILSENYEDYRGLID